VKLKHRIGIFLSGALLVFAGLGKFQQFGVFPYHDRWMQPVYPAGVIAVGLFVGLLAFLPGGEWMERILRGRRQHTARALQKSDRHG
jgi:uncharacterized membrane protein